MVRSIIPSSGASTTPGALTALPENITTDIYDFSSFERFVDFFGEIFTFTGERLGESLIGTYREIHKLLLSKCTPSSHDVIGERFQPILGLVKMLDITPENKREYFRVSTNPQGDEYVKIRVCYRDTSLVDRNITSNELTFLEKNLFNKNNGEITYPTEIDSKYAFESLFLDSYKAYAKQNIEKEIQEIVTNVNDIILHSESRDIDRLYSKDVPMKKIWDSRDSRTLGHGDIIDMIREPSDDFDVAGMNMSYVLKYNTGNCMEMTILSAMLMSAILEKRIHSLGLNTNVCNGMGVSVLVTPFPGEKGYVEGCDHAVANVAFNFYGAEVKYIVDSWVGRFFEYKNEKDIKNNYSGDSYFVNKNIRFREHYITKIINKKNYIDMLKRDMSKIHKVNLDDAIFADPFKQERDRREAALANRFRYGSSL